MPKLKTKKGVAKRLRLTKKGKIKYATCGKSHLLSSKTTKRIRHLRKSKTVDGKKDIKYIKRMLPYG
ncbi:MAG: 50S ribosomal protein L35 [Candidatus Omnitrophota bacterium]|jgi:large subunit ribosomal protein L35